MNRVEKRWKTERIRIRGAGSAMPGIGSGDLNCL